MLTDTKIASLKPPASGQDEHSDHKVTGLRLRVGSGGKKTWTLRRRVGAKVINRKLGNYPAMGLAAARSAAETLISALERDGSTEAIDRTFGSAAIYWVEHVAKDKNDRWRNQERQLQMHVLPMWVHRRLIDIKRADVRDLIDGIEGAILPNRVLALIKTIFRYAVERDWLATSPAEGVRKPKSEISRDRVLDMGEIGRIWVAASLLGYPIGPYLQMLLLTAQRRSEVAAMRWADLDLAEGTWALCADDTKADRAHLVPLSPAALSILKTAPELGEFVFTTDGRSHVQEFAKGKAKLDEFIAAKGEALKPWVLHDLRRSAATHMVRLGISETTVGRVLNHAPQGVTARVYALHSYAPEKRNALNAWAAEISRVIGGNAADNVVQLHG